MNISKLTYAVAMSLMMLVALPSCDKEESCSGDTPVNNPDNYKPSNEVTIEKATIAKKVAIKPTDYTFNEYLRSKEFGAFKSKVAKFSNKAAVAIGAAPDGNTAVSPVSIFMALAMAAESADGDTRQEILDAMGITYDELNSNIQYVNYICNAILDHGSSDSNGKNQIKCVNSLWVNSDVKVKDDGVKALTTKYYSDLMSMNFAEDDVNALLTSYISNETNGLLSPNLEASPDVALILMNVVYLRDVWNEFGSELWLSDKKYDFVNYDGSKTNTPLLMGHYNSGKAVETEKFRKFRISTYGGLSLTFYVPQDGHTLDEIYTTEVLNDPTPYITADMESNPNVNYSFHTRCIFPEFKADFDGYLENTIKQMGVDKFFKRGQCDFSHLSDEKVYCSKIRHVSKLEVTRKGIEGAAVTVEMMEKAMDPGPNEKVWEDVYYDFIVDRNFAYVLSKDGVPVFTGVVKSIK